MRPARRASALFQFRRVLGACVFSLAFAATSVPPAAAADFALAENDTVLFYGDGTVERLLEAGALEAELQLAHPGKNIRVRSVAWTGDEVGYQARPEGYADHLKSLLAQWPATVVVLGYGGNESFAGAAGLPEFRRRYERLLGEIARRHPGAKRVLLAPLALEAETAPAGADAAGRNREREAYAREIADLARADGARFVDLFAASRDAYARSAAPLTSLGLHLTPEGAHEVGRHLARVWLGPAGVAGGEPPRVAEVALAAARKHAHNAELVRPKNGALYYGVRKRPEENAAEIPRYHALLDAADDIVRALAAQPAARLADFPPPSLPPLPPGRAVKYRFPGGTIKTPAELAADFTVADGYALNLFASEEQFPELRSPVQLSFDARGRLWVVTMPSFPHTIPGETPRDRILVLEDTDRDGRADTCTTFADGFDALDGVAFHERGTIVSAQPRLLLMADTDGDGRADTRSELLRGVDVTDSHHGGMIATDPMGYVMLADGVFHRSQFETPFGVVRGIDSTTYRFDPRDGRIRTEWQSLTPNPWKVSFDRFGNALQRYGGGHVLDALPLTWLPLGVYHEYGHGTVLNYAKGSALSVISSPNFPDELQQGVASASLLGSYIVSVSPVAAADGPLVATKRLDLLTTKNSTFRPVDVEFGFDGALYVSDFSSLIIGHAQHPMRDPQWNHERGRIWRVVHTGKPTVRDWPKIEGATPAELTRLLGHPQNIVRHHARIALRRAGPAALGAVGAYVAGVPATPRAAREQALLEAAWIFHTAGELRADWLGELARAENPLVRAAGVQLVRLEFDRLPDAVERLAAAARDPHPRVAMAAVNAVAHLRPTRPAAEQALAGFAPASPAVQRMVRDLAHGTAPHAGRSMPVLNVLPETRLAHWQTVPAGPAAEVSPPPEAKNAKAARKDQPPRTLRTFIESTQAQAAVLSVKHSFLDVTANGVRVLSAENPFSSEQQVTLALRPGLNAVEITYRRLRAEPPPVYLFDPVGQPVAQARLPENPAHLETMAAAWAKTHAAEAGVLRVQAVPNQLLFAPAELRAKAGARVRVVFENPDLMPHNWVLVAPGADETVGVLADAMATEPTGAARHFVPAAPGVLHATPLVEPNGRAELSFTAPAQPGRYPYLCTFPGHWRIMRGVLVVE